MKFTSKKYPPFNGRTSRLLQLRNLKMTRSAHAYVRGNTVRFYEWLESANGLSVPQGPSIWICGDCHVSNLGPLANVEGKIAVQIRDVDQTVIGNPAHDLIRLGLSLATAARGSDLPGVTTAQMLEQIIIGYKQAFRRKGATQEDPKGPELVQRAMRRAQKRKWKHLAEERIEGISPAIPLGKRFWPLSQREKRAIGTLFQSKDVQRLATLLRSREDDAEVEVLDSAYWLKGCSSLGRLRYAILLRIGGKQGEVSLMDIKEAVAPAGPFDAKASMPRDQAERVVQGALHLTPFLGERMLSSRFLGRSVFLRELLPQDMKIDIQRVSREEAIKIARFLAGVVGTAHVGQMDAPTRKSWLKEMNHNRSSSLEAPSWLWSSVVELIVSHEAAYLEHCRQHA